MPLRTARGWLQRDAQSGLPSALAEALQSPEGVHFLHTLCVAAVFLFNVRAGVGLAMIQQFFTYAGLHTLIAVSETSLRRQRRTMLGVIGRWGDTERERLAPLMKSKSIVVAADETFHDGTMLVAMHPTSGFIFLEKRVDQRDAVTWTTALRSALQPWPVTVVMLLGDEAKGLIGCATRGLGIVKSSDLFHVQQTISRGIAGPMGALIRVAEAKIEDAQEALRTIEKLRALAAQRPRDTDDAQAMAAEGVMASQAVVAAQKALETVHTQGAAIREAVRGLGDRYHPIDLDTGEMLTPTGVAERLRQGFEKVRTSVREAGLGAQQRVEAALAKAQRVLPSLSAMVVTWHRLATAALDDLSLSTLDTAWVWSTLLPMLYLEHVAALGRDRDERQRLKALCDLYEVKVKALDGPWHGWSMAQRQRVAGVVKGVVELFVRASSCVEGRNGQWSLHHHHTHRLSDPLLRALTVVHNYVLRRDDGTTAAERLTGVAPADLFAHLLDVMPLPRRPRVRPRKPRPPRLEPGKPQPQA